MMNKIAVSPVFLFIIALLIAIPALFINLGEQPLIDDEAIRGLVALEMLEKGDFITPSIAGELYLKKPPMYNWLIALSFMALDRQDEFALRLPMVISLIFFTLVIFYYFRKEMGVKFAAISSLLFLTSGRILIYESLHGLIDITYSMVIFIFFMHIYRSYMQGRLLKLFIVGYLLIAFSYLLKGLPSIVFLGITMLVLFISNKKFKLLFHWGHYVGILIFIAIVGGYYLLYFSRNDIAPEDMFSVIIGESTRRTAIRFGFWRTALHLLSYPFSILYHFLPWGIMAILLFRKGAIRLIRKQSFIRYLTLVFLANIVVYWISPEVFPRYILMLIPLMLGVFVFLYLKQKEENTLQVRIVEWVYGGVIGLTVVAAVLPFFIELPLERSFLIMLGSALVLILGSIQVFYWKDKSNRLLWMVIALLIIRIGFNLVVLPVRVAESNEAASRDQLREIIKKTDGQDLMFYWNTEFEPNPYYGYRIPSYRANYYLALYKDHAIQLDTSRVLDPDILYISRDFLLDPAKIEEIENFEIPGLESKLVLFRAKTNVR